MIQQPIHVFLVKQKHIGFCWLFSLKLTWHTWQPMVSNLPNIPGAFASPILERISATLLSEAAWTARNLMSFNCFKPGKIMKKDEQITRKAWLSCKGLMTHWLRSDSEISEWFICNIASIKMNHSPRHASLLFNFLQLKISYATLAWVPPRVAHPSKHRRILAWLGSTCHNRHLRKR